MSVLNECVCVFVCLFLASVCVLLRCMREKMAHVRKCVSLLQCTRYLFVW